MVHFNLFFGLGPAEIGGLVVLALIMFGGKKIPELARGLGKGIKEFNSAKASIEEEVKESIREIDKK
jgi:sec-independent protein translocase protein TatA